LRTLMDTATGSFAVTTESSTYVIDLDAMTVSRSPGSGPSEVATMRRDGETLTLLVLAECTVGRALAIFVDLGIDGVPWTFRASTDVRSIELAPHGEMP